MTGRGGPTSPPTRTPNGCCPRPCGRWRAVRDGPAERRAASVGGRAWSTAQVVLLALIVGLLVGMGAGIISLLV